MVGAVLWTLVMVATALSAEFFRIIATNLSGAGTFEREPWRALASGLLIPIFTFAAPWPPLHIAAFVLIALVALALGLLFISRRDLPLAEEE
jgi:hypothetical protein